LHKRFRIQVLQNQEEDDLDGGFIILNIDGSKIGIIIDRVARVVSVKGEDVKEPPQMLSGIGTEYIEGVIREDNGYLIMLNTRKLFDGKELQKIIEMQ
jgi:purine-binding chemotaxis protein CheW